MIDICTITIPEIETKKIVDTIINTKHFVKYGSKAIIHHNIRKQLVLSMLFYKDIKSNSTILGMMISQFNTWYYCELEIVQLDTIFNDPYGYTYYSVHLTDKEYMISDRDTIMNKEHIKSLWKTGIGLPCYWKELSLQYYTFLTDDGYNLNSKLTWSLIS